MKKQYIFLILIIMMLYIIFLISNYKYKEYEINTLIDQTAGLNIKIKQQIIRAKNIIQYKSSKAYRNKIIKEEQSMKNKGEKVVYLTLEQKYNKFTKESILTGSTISTIENQNNVETKYMSNFEKWKHFLFKK